MSGGIRNSSRWPSEQIMPVGKEERQKNKNVCGTHWNVSHWVENALNIADISGHNLILSSSN